MKFLKKFEYHSYYEYFLESNDYVTPNVCACVNEKEVHYNSFIPTPFLTFTAEQANSTISFNRVGTETTLANATLQYSTDNGDTWKSYVLGTAITLEDVGDSVKFKGTNGAIGMNVSNYHKFVMTGKIAATGEITSLFNEVGGDFNIPANGCFCLFSDCTSLTTAPELPSTTLDRYCYSSMFYGCTSLTTAPSLPSTTLAEGCYQAMFSNCTSLINAPELPSMIMASSCYNSMFSGCTSLTTAPVLPATTLATYCYTDMFRGCTSLVNAPIILPATTLVNGCYYEMFYGCSALTIAPELPATTLTNYCYNYMFQKCASLNYIKAMFTTTPSNTYTSSWVSGVASAGTFVKNEAAEWTNTGISSIPTGWTVQTASA